MIRVFVPASTAVPVSRGHPWVLREPGVDPPGGELVMVVDGRGRTLGYGLSDRGAIAVRMLSRDRPSSLPQLIRSRILAAARHRERMFGADVTGMRLVHGEGDGLGGLVVDRYDELAVVRLYAAGWEPWLPDIVDALRTLPWARHGLRRLGVGVVDDRSGAEDLWGQPPDEVVISEYGMLLLARPRVGQKTGLFLDQREHRRMVRQWSRGAKVANLFSYNGGFSVAAALGGATRVVSVDISAAALEDAKDNFRLNGLAPEVHGFEAKDAFTWQPQRPVDLLVLDPPSLAHNATSVGAAFSAYRKLHRHHEASVAPGGLMVTASCTGRLPADRWLQAVREGLDGPWSWVAKGAEPADHPVALNHAEGAYLKFAALRRAEGLDERGS